MTRPTVAVYGAGVAGLSVAHELAKHNRALRVCVYEADDWIGGKARSQYVEFGRGDQVGWLPGEHGFRFFPAFYSHLDETLSEIPTSHGRHVLQNLVPSREFGVARSGRAPLVASRRLDAGSLTLRQVSGLTSSWFSRNGLGLSSQDLAAMSQAVVRFLISSETRRANQFDRISWYDFVGCGPSNVSEDFRVLSSTLPRMMVAMDGRRGSAYTLGKILCQLAVLDPWRSPERADRVLNGPTDEAWLKPWYRHLESHRVEFNFGIGVDRLELEEDVSETRIACAHLSNGDVVRADYHVCALPVDRFSALIDPAVARSAPSLGRARRHLANDHEWMVGAQYFLRRPLPAAHGHVIYADSPWALTSVCQDEFWSREYVRKTEGLGVRGVLSVDISDWDAVAPRLRKSAKECTREEILKEVFAQIAESLGGEAVDRPLTSHDVVHRHLDQNVSFRGPGGRVSSNKSPLFVHRPGAFRHRPTARTELPNLFLASDFVATFTNLASMESANEAARRATRALLAKTGSVLTQPAVRELAEPDALRPLRRLDALLFASSADAEVLDQEENLLSDLGVEALRRPDQIARAARHARRFAAFDRPGRVSLHKTRDGLLRVQSALEGAYRIATRRSFPAFPRVRGARRTHASRESGSRRANRDQTPAP